MTDQELYNLAKRYGENALMWRRKFVGLLPEIHRRRLWEKKGFLSIFEFGKKLAGLSEEQIRLALNLEKRFADKPRLKSLLVDGEVGLHKLERVASVATVENEAELAAMVKILPKKAVETFVRKGFDKLKNEPKSTPGREIELSGEVKGKLLELQEKGLDVNEILLDLLERREREIQEEKAEVGEAIGEAGSRHIPARVRRILREEHGDKCSIKDCGKPAKHLHHTQTFALSKSHDPRYLAPLCVEHHRIAHAVSVKMFAFARGGAVP